MECRIVDINHGAYRVYFSIYPTGAGFTDQLLQFSAFYRLGLSLGYTYKHVRFHSPRSASLASEVAGSQSFVHAQNGFVGAKCGRVAVDEIYEFLGFNDYFAASSKSSISVSNMVDIVLSDELLMKEGINNFDKLKIFVEASILSCRRMSDGIVVNFRLGGRRKFLG